MKIWTQMRVIIARNMQKIETSEFHSYAVTRMVCYEKISAVASLTCSNTSGREAATATEFDRNEPWIGVGCIDTKIKDVCTFIWDFTSARLVSDFLAFPAKYLLPQKLSHKLRKINVSIADVNRTSDAVEFFRRFLKFIFILSLPISVSIILFLQ